MTRPINETEADRQRELSVADIISVFIGCKLVKTRQLSCADYVVQSLDGVATGLMEIKVRKFNPEQMDERGGFFISEKKLIAAYKVVVPLKMDFHLVVQADKNILHLSLKDDKSWPKLERMKGGNYARNQNGDIETMCLFPTKMFTKVK